jgi:hypothetical protein
MIMGRGIPISQSSAPLPKVMSTSSIVQEIDKSAARKFL